MHRRHLIAIERAMDTIDEIDHPILTAPQRERLLDLLSDILVFIRFHGASGDSERAVDIADSMNWWALGESAVDECSDDWEAIRERLFNYEQRYAGGDGWLMQKVPANYQNSAP